MDTQQENENEEPNFKRRSYRRRTIKGRKEHKHTLLANHRHHHHHKNNSINIPFVLPPTLPSSWIVKTTTQVLVHHLLYARGLIPLTVQQLYQETEAEQKRVRSSFPPSLRRKITQTKARLDAWQALWSSMEFCLEDCPIVLITLGPSFSRPREYYVLDAKGLANQRHHHQQQQSRLPSSHVLARRLLPKLVEQDASELPSRNASSYQLFVSVCIPSSESLERLWQEQQPKLLLSSTSPPSSLSSSPSLFPTTLLRRQGFRLFKAMAALKPNQRMVRIQLQQRQEQQHTNANATTLSNNNNNNSVFDETEECHWISLSTSIKGFRF